jgi:hypothetical protein
VKWTSSRSAPGRSGEVSNHLQPRVGAGVIQPSTGTSRSRSRERPSVLLRVLLLSLVVSAAVALSVFVRGARPDAAVGANGDGRSGLIDLKRAHESGAILPPEYEAKKRLLDGDLTQTEPMRRAFSDSDDGGRRGVGGPSSDPSRQEQGVGIGGWTWGGGEGSATPGRAGRVILIQFGGGAAARGDRAGAHLCPLSAGS